MTKLGPGMYHNGANAIHVDLAEMLAHYGYQNTPVNRAAFMEAAADVISDLVGAGKEMEITVTTEPLEK